MVGVDEEQKTKNYWILDAALGIGFFLSFLLDFTSLALHQWLGILIGAGAFTHLLLHNKWLQITVRNFSSRASNRSRWYLIVDGLLGMGFLGIIITGLVISTWVNLYFENYPIWLAVHITVSIQTMILLVVKLVLHRQWIAATTRKVFNTGHKTPLSPVPVPVTSDLKGVDRRDFLKLAGIVGAASVVALVKAADGWSQVGLNDDGTLNSDVLAAEIPDAETIQAVALDETEEAIESTQDLPAQTLQDITAESTATPVPTATQVVQQQASCVVRCPRGCSYPGRCHKYTDSNFFPTPNHSFFLSEGLCHENQSGILRLQCPLDF